MRDILYKFLSLFSIIRIFNVLVIITAQYLTAIFIISQEKTFESVLFDFNLFLLIICSSIAIASGYIINNFYDYEKDLSRIQRLPTFLRRFFCLYRCRAFCQSNGKRY